jgi:hypothetical protein
LTRSDIARSRRVPLKVCAPPYHVAGHVSLPPRRGAYQRYGGQRPRNGRYVVVLTEVEKVDVVLRRTGVLKTQLIVESSRCRNCRIDTLCGSSHAISSLSGCRTDVNLAHFVAARHP